MGQLGGYTRAMQALNLSPFLNYLSIVMTFSLPCSCTIIKSTYDFVSFGGRLILNPSGVRGRAKGRLMDAVVEDTEV